MDFVEVLFIQRRHFFCDFIVFERIHFKDKGSVVCHDFFDDVLVGHRAVRVLLLEVQFTSIVFVLVDETRSLQLLLRDVDDPVYRFSIATTAHKFLFDLYLVNNRNSMVVVLSPYVLSGVKDVGVVMAALSRSIVDADSMQVVRHLLQGRILVLQLIFLALNLLLKASDLLPDLISIDV